MWTANSWYEEARLAAARDPAIVRNMANLYLALYKGALPDLPEKERVRLLAASNRERLDAVPDLTRYPELRGMRDLVAATWRGYKDGAKLTDPQLAAYCNGTFLYHRSVHGTVDLSQKCSYIFFPESDHGPLLANNLDSSPAEPFGPPDWAPPSEHMIFGTVSSGVHGDELSPEIFPAPVSRLLARYCCTTDEAVELLTRYNFFWGPCNALLADRDKNVAMIEKSACRIGVRRSPDGFGFVTAMTAEEPGMNAFLRERRAASLIARNLPDPCADTVYWNGADHRHELMKELLNEARSAPTLEKLRSIIQFRDSARGQVCYNGEVFFPGGPPCEYTLRTSIWLLREGRAKWWAKEGDVPSFENPKPDVHYSDVWLWD